MDFMAEYKKARNLIKGAKLDDLLTRITLYIRKHELSPSEVTEKGQPMPWLIFDIMKMAVLHAETNQKIKPVDEEFFAKIYNKLYELDSVYGTALLKQDGPRSFFTAIAFKQFWYQYGMYKGDFARANFLFRSGTGHYIDQFEEINGFSSSEYVEMVVVLWILLESSPETIYDDYKKHLVDAGHKEQSVDAFLGMISRTKESLKEELIKQDDVIGHPLLKFGEHTPLFRYPLLKIKEDSYVAYGRMLLERAMCLNLFEFAKAETGEEGIQDFAANFEEYTSELLRSSGAEYIREDRIKELYGGKQTDFLVHEGELSIMIEAKSVRISDLARANPTKETIPNALEDNVIKAIFQGMELSNKLYEEDNSRSFALIVVAYDDVFLGPPEDAYEYYLKDYCEKQYEEGNFERGQLKPEAIFLVSVRDFEQICTTRKAVGDFSSILSSAIEGNKEAETKKFSLIQSCPKVEIKEGLCVVDQNFNDLWEDITARFMKEGKP